MSAEDMAAAPGFDAVPTGNGDSGSTDAKPSAVGFHHGSRGDVDRHSGLGASFESYRSKARATSYFLCSALSAAAIWWAVWVR